MNKNIIDVGINYLKSLSNRMFKNNITISKEEMKEKMLEEINSIISANKSVDNPLIEQLIEIKENYETIFNGFYEKRQEKTSSKKITQLSQYVNRKQQKKKELDVITMYNGKWRKTAPPTKKEIDNERG